jgi:hypothetical protein
MGLWCWAYFQVLIRHLLVLNIFPFPVSTAKLIGDFYNKRRKAAKSCPRFAYSFVSLMLRQYFGLAIRSLPIGEVQQRKKNPKTAANLLRFANWRGEGTPLCL